jgi:hypothetical protein
MWANLSVRGFSHATHNSGLYLELLKYTQSPQMGLKGVSMKVSILFIVLFFAWNLSHAADRPGPQKKEVETGVPVSSTSNTVTYETSNGKRVTVPRVDGAPTAAGAIPVSSTSNTITYLMKDGSRKTFPRVK